MYSLLVFVSLVVVASAALAQFVLAFVPRFSVVTLGNAVLLALVWVPLATNSLVLGTRVGWCLFGGSVVCFLVLLVRWAEERGIGKTGPHVLTSLLGLLAFGFHVFLFSATP